MLLVKSINTNELSEGSKNGGPTIQENGQIEKILLIKTIQLQTNLEI